MFSFWPRMRARFASFLPLPLLDICLGILLARVLPLLLQRIRASSRRSNQPKISLDVGSHADLVAHTKIFDKKVIKIGENVLVAIGYALANSICVIGENGLIIIDTCESEEAAKDCLMQFRAYTQLPVKAIIYTHFHHDHVAGAGTYLAAADTDCPIYAHHSTAHRMLHFNLVMGPLAYVRASRQFGSCLSPPALENSGIGPFLREESSSLHLPTHTFNAPTHTIYIAGVELVLIHAPGETDDQVVVYMPSQKILFAADNFYEAFPNLYAIRGVPHRDVKQWIYSLDLMCKQNAEIMVPSHTLPVYGREEVQTRLSNYRDALAFVHDQTIRLALKGEHPDTIARSLQLPPSLMGLEYLKEYYGTVAWSAKAIFSGYLGWFSGESSELFPLAPKTRAEKLTQLAGGSSNCLQAAQVAANVGEHQWALELASAVLLVDTVNDVELELARKLRVMSLTSLAELQVSANARNYFITQALETKGDLVLKVPNHQRHHAILTAPLPALFQTLSYRVDPNCISLGCPTKLKVKFPDVSFFLELRNSVMIVTESYYSQESDNKQVDVEVCCEEAAWRQLLINPLSIASNLVVGNFIFKKGNLLLFRNFMSCLDATI